MLLLSDEERAEAISSLSDADAALLLYDWQLYARAEQLHPEGEWATWLVEAGRGFGKSRTGAEWIRGWAESGKISRMHLVARTAADVRDVMIEGESGLLNICPSWNKPLWYPSRRQIIWPNGCVAQTFSADEPESLRGPQCEKAWADEVGAWRYPEAWDMLMFGLRIGDNPQCIATTTPRPTKLIKQIRKLPSTIRTHGSTYDNKDNLAPSFFTAIINRYEGTRLGRQEINGELLEDNPGALWNMSMIDDHRIQAAPALRRIVVAIDPPASSKKKSTENKGDNVRESDEAGIIVAGIGVDGHGYVLADRSFIAKPEEWGKAAVKGYRDFSCDRIIGETNNGGEMVEFVIKATDASVPFKGVHASRGKIVRAEPISALYEQGRIHHVGSFPTMEDQMCDYNPLTSKDSPDRMDALVWAFTELMFAEGMGMLDHMANQHDAAMQAMEDKGMAALVKHKRDAISKKLEELKAKTQKGGRSNG
jgi:phage terminase large subunit-like protein